MDAKDTPTILSQLDETFMGEDTANIARIEREDGSVEIEFLDPEEEYSAAVDQAHDDHYVNLAEVLDEDYLQEIAIEVVDGCDEDDASRETHLSNLVRGIENLGLDDSNVETPFEGASTVFHPLIMENAVKIQAKAEGELLPASGPVKTQIIGKITDETEEQAYRIKRHMNWQLTEQMSEFYVNGQKALLQAPLFGDAFRKNYYDPIKGRNCDTLVPLDLFVVNAMCADIESAERITEIQYISEREMLARQYSGLYREVDLVEPYRLEKSELGDKIDSLLGYKGTGAGYCVLEQHVYLDIEGFEHPSGVPLPYVVCVEKETRTVLSIRRNWNPEGNEFKKLEWYTQYPFVPGFGFYNLGYIHLLGNFQNTLTAIMRSLIDSGSFSNMQGGFKTKAMRVLDDGSAVSPGEWRDVEFYGTDLSKGLYPFNFKEPSSTLYSLMEFIESRGQKFADSAEQVISDAANYGPVGTTMALLDASTKFFSTIFKRFHAAQKKQFKILAHLNYENLISAPDGISFNIPGEELRIQRQDYDGRIDIIPVSDPNISSAAHRITLASQKLQSGLQAPDVHDVRELYKSYYSALGDENYERYLPAKEDAIRREPMDDIMAAMQGETIKAFEDQDHEAHIMVKTAFLNDPSVAGNPNFGAVAPAIQANIREHTVMRFKEQLDGAEQLGLNAQQAAQEIAQFNQYKAANPLGMQDPKQIIAQAEMLKQENDAKKLALREDEIALDAGIDIAKLKLDAAKHDIKIQNDKDILKFKEATDFIKTALQ